MCKTDYRGGVATIVVTLTTITILSKGSFTYYVISRTILVDYVFVLTIVNGLARRALLIVPLASGIDGCYSSKFLRSSARQFSLDPLTMGTMVYRFTTYQDARRVRLVDGLE